MRAQFKEVKRYLELYLGEEMLLTLDRTFLRSDVCFWEVASREAFFELFYSLEEKMAFRAASWLLSRRSMHSEQLKKRLKERHFSEGAVEYALEELLRLGLLSDSDFEANFVQKLQKQGKSRREILLKAKMKGIAPDKILVPLSSEEETLKALIEKRYPVLLQRDAPYPLKQKALAALYRKGFSSISCILKDFLV
jgi:SOS response regulatory protein OraA/RecX